MSDKKNLFVVVLIVALMLMALPNLIAMLRGTAEVPDVFSDGYTLAEATAMSIETGKPVLALATADWCPPCQTLKRGPLQDPEIVAMINANAIPVYLEESKNPQELQQLGLRSYPTTFILEGNQVVAALSGGSQYKRFLEQELIPVP